MDEPTHDDLVAYLDGELDPEERRRLERRLKSDRLTRNEFRRLRRVWQYLDQLPQATVDTSFSRSTVEMAVVAAEEEIEHARTAAPAVRRKRGLTAMGACLATGLASFLIAAALWPDPDQQPIRDLPLIENFKTLRRQAAWQLSPADTQAVTSWLHDLVATNPRIRRLLAENQHDVLKNLTTREREQLRHVGPRRRRIAMTLYALQQARTDKAPALLGKDDFNRLREQLSPRAQKTLDEATSPGKRRRVIFEWVRQAVRGPLGPRELHRRRQEIPRETLERFFADDLTDNDLREELLNLPSGEMEQRLRELYRRQAMAMSPGPAGRRSRTRRDGPRPPKSHTRPPPPRGNDG